IMTLSRGPYSELDKMSLFQDLKLKRRKIDSRCSSDGESVADTSTSSPDLLAPMSPKMCDSGGGGGGGVGVGGIVGSNVAASMSLVTLTATTSLTSTTSTPTPPATCTSSSAMPQHQVAAEVVVATAKAVAAAVAAKNEQLQQQQQQQRQEQTEIHSSCGMSASSTAVSNMMTPPAPVRTSPPMSTEMAAADSAERRTPSSNRATPTPPHNNGNASSSTSNGGGSSRASPDSMDDKPTTTTTTASLLMSANGMHGGSSNPNSSMSVIRSVKEERILASPTRMLAYHQQQQQQQQQQQGCKTPTQSQQHVTVLVTPSRIKSEPQPPQPPHSPYSQAVSASTTTLSPSSLPGNPNTSAHNTPSSLLQQQQQHHHQQQQQHQQQNPPPPIVTTHHLHQQLTQPQLRKNSPPHDLQFPPQHHHLLTQSMQHLTQQQQLQLLQQAAAMSRQNNPATREMSPSASMSPSSRHSSSSKSPQQHLMQQHQQQQQQNAQHMRIKKEPTAMQNHVTGFGNGGSGGAQRHHSPHFMQQQSPNQQAGQQQGPPPPQLPPQALGNMAQALMHPASLQSLRHPNRDAALIFRVKNEVQQQVAAAAAAAAGLPQLMQPGAAAVAAAAAQRMVWVSNARINGVKPEVIGGPMGSIRPGGPGQSPSPHHSSSSASSTSQLSPQTPSQTPPRGTPTVIMGESCGVRTMVWGYEPAAPSSSAGSASQSPNSHHHGQHHLTHQQMGGGGGGGPPSSLQSQSHHSSQSSLNTASSPSAGSLTPTHTPGPSPQNNEEAAQLLLSLGQTRIQDNRPRPPHAFRTPHALNMERLWAGDYSQLPPGQLHALNLSAAQQPWGSGGSSNTTGLGRGLDNPHEPTDEDDQPLVCMICEDKATGLHYGIITCEGCKGFFKRTVQNRRVYTCVADGTCEITKAQRNRCQYCRFKKCIEQGMVLQAVREDRMPGGRNSGAVYNLYKVKYKKHKKNKQQQQQQQSQQHSPLHQQQGHHQPQLSPHHHHHHQAHLFMPQQQQQQLQQQQFAAAVAAATHQQQTKLLGEMKPMFLSKEQQALHSPHHQAQQSPALGPPPQQQQQQQQQQAPPSHLSSPHHALHGSAAGGPLHSPMAGNIGQQQTPHHGIAGSPVTGPPSHMTGAVHQPSAASQRPATPQETAMKIPSHLVNGTILKTALTNPSEIVHLRHRLDSAVSSSKDRQISYEHSLSMIQTLIDCDAMEDIATLPHFSEFLEDKSEISEKLCNIGDSIVHKLVSWTKKLPFYLEIPVEIHTKLLTDKWHEILILTTAAYQALHGKRHTNANTATTTTNTTSSSSAHSNTSASIHKDDPEFVAEVNAHLSTLQTCLTTLMGQPIAMEQLKLDVGHMVDKMTQITIMFRRIKLKMEEYVCLKVYILLNKAEVELESIQERYIQVLRTFLQHSSPQNPQARLNELLSHIPEIQAAASLLLESKMFYVPFVLNSASIR
ncbi:hormone receptor 4-like, partial [Musca vetustissima]|uniref:hormone receptor 4-like n=1 Tax=Musca vetustissima TaxID=27455 RepID=UPI002AB69F07